MVRVVEVVPHEPVQVAAHQGDDVVVAPSTRCSISAGEQA